MSKKRLNTRTISNELAGGASLFFPNPSSPPLPAVKPEKTKLKTQTPAKTVPNNQVKEIKDSQIKQQNQEVHSPVNEEKKDINHDAMTSLLHEINLRVWNDMIENTETHNSSLRLTNEENYAAEDMINELKRSLKVKTSLNEVARLGLLYIIHDFEQNRETSLIYKVKKS
jgi:hypothetical protein